MKCGILTFHRAQNFGGILQAYALQKSVEKLGVDCEIVDYRSPFIEKYFKPYSLKNLPSIKRMAAIVLYNGRVKDNRVNFDEFSKKHLKTSNAVFENKDQLLKCNDEYDLFIAGSDQVWSYLTAGFDKSYFLEFVKNNSKKNSYAASFGVESIPKKYHEEYYGLLKDFNNISVREEQGAQIVKEILDYEPPVVLDPTLLLNRDEWSKIATAKPEKHKYLLLYLIAESKTTLSLAKKIAKERNLKIIYINDRLYKRNGMENRSKIGVNKWVELFLNASCIVTNSFHGVAFSINFKKDFYMQYLPEPAKVNSRLENILTTLDLTSRNIKDVKNFDIGETIDYSRVHEKLLLSRQNSIEYLRKVIEGAQEGK